MPENEPVENMLIIAGYLEVEVGDRDAYVAECRAVVEAGRKADGCLDFSISADSVDASRILIYEQWESEEQLLAFRSDGPSGDQKTLILSADVKRYVISSVGAP